MFIPPFEDIHAGYTADGFNSTNEEPRLMNELLHGRRFRKSLSIASAGEVLLFNILPRSESLLGVDHSYRSLTAVYIKIALLQELGAVKLRALFIRNDLAEITSFVDKIDPATVPVDINKYKRFRDQYDIEDIRKNWYFINPRTLDRIVPLLPRLTLLHADLFDVKDRGPFDFVYTSNAHEHIGRSGKYLDLGELGKLVAPGGYWLLTSNQDGPTVKSYSQYNYSGTATQLPNDTFKSVKCVKGFRTVWTYHLFQRVK